ncbi:MAG: flagellar basal body L-ring protein FlgH [Oleiharenicola lentus]
MKTAPKSASKLPGLVAFVGLTTAVFAGGGSLWPAGGQERGMTADHRAARTGDILTVEVAEIANATSAQTKSSNRESSINDAISQFVFSKGLTHNGETPALTVAGKSAYTGGGQVNNSQSLTSRAAVLVTDVLPNGTLVIEGARRITFSGETQYVVLHGLVRPDDVSSANTVVSSNVADAHVEFVSEGALTDAQKRGWLAKLYEKLRPI